MEAKCQVCNEFFDKHDIVVTQDGTYCEPHVPVDAKLGFFTLHVTWKGINALMDYIDGSVDLEVLNTIETMRKALDKRILEQLRSRLGVEQVRESNPESVEPGDENR